MEEVVLSEFIDQVYKDVEDTIINKGRYLTQDIEIEVIVTKIVKAQGGLKVYVVNGGAEAGQTHSSRIKIVGRPPSRDTSSYSDDEKDWSIA